MMLGVKAVMNSNVLPKEFNVSKNSLAFLCYDFCNPLTNVTFSMHKIQFGKRAIFIRFTDLFLTN